MSDEKTTGIAFYKTNDKNWLCVLGVYDMADAYMAIHDFVPFKPEPEKIVIVKDKKTLELTLDEIAEHFINVELMHY